MIPQSDAGALGRRSTQSSKMSKTHGPQKGRKKATSSQKDRHRSPSITDIDDLGPSQQKINVYPMDHGMSAMLDYDSEDFSAQAQEA